MSFTITNERSVPAGLNVQIVHRADTAFPFLHDTIVSSLGGRLLMAWYNCTENEMVGHTVIRGRWSSDGGKTWSEPEIIAEDSERGLHMVPVIFSEHNGEIWAYVTEMTAPDKPVGYACVRYEDGRWFVREHRGDLVLFNTLPQPLPDGRWIVSGRMAARPGLFPEIPIVAASQPSSPADWLITRFPASWAPDEDTLRIPETALIAGKSEITAFVRDNTGEVKCASSFDLGASWTSLEDAGLPAAPVKMDGGTLPNGRQYLIFNEKMPANDRSRLILALKDDGSNHFDTAYILADGFNEALDAGPYWHYPCACAANGRLYISATASAHSIVRHAALFSIPLSNL